MLKMVRIEGFSRFWTVRHIAQPYVEKEKSYHLSAMLTLARNVRLVISLEGLSVHVEVA